ncbi:DUF2157 domain-containing protein [Paenibacillus agricola]|uniref:DUF2157 domain-containing protein n=1 Tax=Paenibacillus agricola TaxID=2716264 RepID=A0ABX0J7M0_9BACL|nr:DUF2157 domain-containing protein [Paenibacillus agricola]NHN30026.1 DUF2157 domain-containing protein [Paenibacillus agricola]
MSRKWVEKEGLLWVEKNIVTREQYTQILDLYNDKKHAIGVLPLLGSILVGLGILSFVAANWQEIPQMARLLMIIVLMVACYGGGELFRKSGNDRLGLAMTTLGLISFGGGIVLIAQMFHLVSYDIMSFIVWGSVGTLLTYLYRSKFLYLISLLIFTCAQWYSTIEHDGFSYVGFIIMAVGLGYYGWKNQHMLLAWFFSLSIVLQSLILVLDREWKFLWIFIPLMALYAVGDWIKDRSSGFALQSVPLAAAFLFAIVMVLMFDDFTDGDRYELLAEPLYFIFSMLVILAASLFGKWTNGRISSGFEWVLLVPVIYLQSSIAVMYLVILFFFSFYVLWSGYMEQWRFKINFGTLLFIVTTMVAYGKLTWAFMDKSLFFILGGLILLGLSWFLNHRKKLVLSDMKKEEEPHD